MTGGIALLLAAALQTVPQTDRARLAFEVASVRESRGGVFRSGPLTVSGPFIRLEGYTIFGLVMDAYHVRDFQVKISPGIAKDDVLDRTYDIVARAPGAAAPPIEDVRIMLQNLLAARFHLVVRREPADMPVYALTVARGGAKLAPSAAAPCRLRTALASDGRNNEDVFSGCPIERLAERLGNLMGDRPVVDHTGLDGRYDFRLVAIPEFRTRTRSTPADIDPVTAVSELGLRLVPQKAPVELVVIDHVEKLAEN